jgi:hypothetical protein
MNARTAEALIRRYLPGKRTDSRIEKAVRFAEQDPELARALREQNEFDEQMVDTIHYIKPPENLRQKLAALSALPGAEKQRLRSHIINPAILTAILGVILISGVVVFFVIEAMEKFPGREGVEKLLGNAGKMSGNELELMSTTTNELGDWLYMRGYESYEVPPELAALPVIGSRVFRSEGRAVAQVAVGNTDAMRFLIHEFRASDFGVQLPSGGPWLVMTKDDWVGAVRQQGDQCFLVAFRGTKAEMDDLLKSFKK